MWGLVGNPEDRFSHNEAHLLALMLLWCDLVLHSKSGFLPLFTHCILGNFSCRLLIFSKLNFCKNSFRNTIRMSNSLDPDQARRFVGPDLGPNCLPSLSAYDIGRQRVTLLNIMCKSYQKYCLADCLGAPYHLVGVS